jgi:hypothetical protein
MNHGKFFSLDLAASRIEDGIAVFDYTDIFDANIAEGTSNITPRYPIFVSITSTSVKFILQYCVYLKNANQTKDKQEFVAEIDPDDFNSDFAIRHMEEVLIELPLTPANGQSLTATLKRLYLTPFPIQLKEEKNYILELIEKRYNKDKSSSNDSIHYQYDLKQQDDLSLDNISYSSLPVYNLLKENSGYELYTLHTIKDKKTNEKKYDKVLQKLVLDFFFDMMHSDVFKNSMHYDEMYSTFMSDFFCSAIIRKAEYYYQRELVNSLPNDVEDISIYAEKLDIAEKHWVECIQSPLSDKHFEFQPKWYDPKSPKASLLDRIENLKKTFSRSYPFTLVDYWFATPEEEMQRVYYPKNKDEKSCSYDLYKYANATKAKSTNKDKENTTEQKEKSENAMSMNLDSVLKRATEVSKWCLKRYDFREAYRISWFYGANSLMLCFLSAIIISVVILESYKTAFCLLAAYVLVMIGCAIYFSIKDKSAIRIVNNVYFFYPRLIAAITAAWFSITLGDNMFKAFFDQPWNGYSAASLLIIIALFVFYEVHRIVPKLSTIKKLLRTIELMVISFAVSLLVGICAINFTGEKMLVRSGYLPQFYHEDVLLHTSPQDGEPTYLLNFAEIDKSQKWNDSIVMNVYTYAPQENMDSVQSILAIHKFANSPHDAAHMNRIEDLKQFNTLQLSKNEIIPTDSIVRKQFLIRHENSELFKDLLPFVKHSDGHPVAQQYSIGQLSLFLLHDFLIQFAVIAMFIGIFIQMIFEEKNVTEA